MASTDPKLTFTVTCTMNARWAAQFLGMLTKMHQLGGWGSSRMIQFFSDGDGDFRPQFSWTPVEGLPSPVRGRGEEELIFDAG